MLCGLSAGKAKEAGTSKQLVFNCNKQAGQFYATELKWKYCMEYQKHCGKVLYGRFETTPIG